MNDITDIETLFKILDRDGIIMMDDIDDIVISLPSMPVCIDFRDHKAEVVAASKVKYRIKELDDYPKQLFLPYTICAQLQQKIKRIKK